MDVHYRDHSVSSSSPPPLSPVMSTNKKSSSILKSDRPKYTRLLQSCDSCRARKVRCVQVEMSDPEKEGISMTLGPNGAKKIPFCKPCIAASINCTYHFKAKKRGPPNQHVRRLRAAAAAAVANGGTPPVVTETTSLSLDPLILPGSGTLNLDPKPASPISPSSPSPHHPHRLSISSSATTTTLASPIPALESPTVSVSPITVLMARSGVIGPDWNVPTDTGVGGVSPVGSPTSIFGSSANPELPPAGSTYAPSNSSTTSPTFLPPSPPAFMPTPAASATYPSIPYPTPTTSRQTTSPSPLSPSVSSSIPFCLTNLAPTSTILHVLSLFFDFVWPLTPCIHRPSFYSDLGEKREERDPLFFALVCSTVSSTLVQVPRSFLPMDREEVRALARRFNDASRMACLNNRDNLSSMMVVIRYFDNIYYFREGKPGSSNAAFGEAMWIATALRMHEEDSYEELDFIEREVRRRAFWLLFGADKSICAISRRPCALRLDDVTVRLATEVDDEFITSRAILPQPPNKTPIISGFNYISKIFQLIGEIVSIVRADARKPPSDASAVARLDEVCEIHRRIMNTLSDAPPELRLRSGGRRPGQGILDSASSGASSLFNSEFDGVGYTQAAIAEVNQLFDNPNANREDAGNAFLVMQANIHVTQHMARLMVEQHRHQLVSSIRSTGYDLSLIHSPAVANMISHGGWTADDRESVAKDLLNVLHSIPILSIATNGPSLVHKVRFVASTLLDSIREADTAPTPAARALNYLWDFLSILTEIERNYSLSEDIPSQLGSTTNLAAEMLTLQSHPSLQVAA